MRPKPTRARRDRHGRGARAGAHPWNGAARFEQLVQESLASLDPAWGSTLASIDITIADIPDLDRLDATHEAMPLAQTTNGDRPQVKLFRHPITVRCTDSSELAALVLDVLIEQLAEVIGMEPEEIDERYGDSD